MSTDEEEILDSIESDILTGDAETQVADRRVRKEDPLKRLQALREIQADRSTRGPFVRVGLSKRSI